MEFAYGLPAWCDERGMPLSWKHFQYGLAYLRRKKVRDELGLHNAVFMANAKDDHRRNWQNEMRMLAGY